MMRLVFATIAAAITSFSYGAEEFDKFILQTVTPKGLEWISKGDDPSLAESPGPKNFKWTANGGSDRIFLRILPGKKNSPGDSHRIAMHAAADVCNAYSTEIEYGSEATPFLGWKSDCTRAGGDVMFVRNLDYVRGSTGYSITRTWYKTIDEESVSAWREMVERVISHVASAPD